MKFADLSIEIGHLYPSDHKREGTGVSTSAWIKQRMDAGAAAALPIAERYRARKRTVSTVVMIDDYTPIPDDCVSVEELIEAVQEYAESSPLDIDFIAFEGAMAETAEEFYALLVPPPADNTGTDHDAAHHDPRWVTNGQTARESAASPRSPNIGLRPKEPPQRTFPGGPPRLHTVYMQIELFSDSGNGERRWSCPFLAAWWQLMRLGMLRDDHGEVVVPPGTIPISADAPFPAKRTLTVLAPDYLEVEASVRNILSQVAVPAEYQQALRDGPEVPDAVEHLKRLSYVFLDDSFHNHALRLPTAWT